MTSYRILLILFLLIAIASFHTQAYGQRTLTASTDEEIIIAFYKTGDSVPNFSRWIKKTEPYIHTPWAKREQVHEEELYRLQLLYQTYDPKKDHLIIKTKVNLKPIKKEGINKDGEKKDVYQLKSWFTNAPDALYFPYQFLDERIIVMPYHLEETMKSTISQADFNFINDNSNPNIEITAIFRMQPYSADLSQPYKIDGLEQWVLTTKVISVEYWKKSGELLWEKTVPWYNSQNTIDIKNLYEHRPEDSKFKKGRVKPLSDIK